MLKRGNKLQFIALLIAITFCFSSFLHDYHVTITYISYKEKTAQITQKIFLDDLEKAILSESNVKLLLTTDKENKNAKFYIENYILKHNALFNDGKRLKINYLGYEIQNELVFVYIESDKLTKLKGFEIYCDVLTEIFQDQANVFHLDLESKKQTLYLNKNNTREKIAL